MLNELDFVILVNTLYYVAHSLLLLFLLWGKAYW